MENTRLLKIEKEITRFSIVTPMVGAIDFGAYYLLLLFLPIHASKGLSCMFAGIAGYLSSKYWTFAKRKLSYLEMGRYGISGLFLLGFNVSTNGTILHFWPRVIFLALAIATFFTAILSFILRKWWVFKSS